MAACERCGVEAAPGARYCAACGHRLGEPPERVTVVQVESDPGGRSPARSVLDGCVGCFSWAVVGVLVVVLVSWIGGC